MSPSVSRVAVPLVWTLAVGGSVALGALALQPRSHAYRAPTLGSGPLFAPRPGGQPALARAQRSTAVVSVRLSDAGCVVAPATVPAGLVEFRVVNPGGTRVTEAELIEPGGTRVYGEAENVLVGRPGSFVLDLPDGDYGLGCLGTGAAATPFRAVATRS